MPAIESPALPRILCLHGAGSSGAIFKAQGRRIFRSLRNEFSFDFIDAPFPSKPGPGMRPAYEDSGPFWRWQCDMIAVEAFDITEAEVLVERDQVRDMILGKLREMGGGVEGIMAFSQGARVATGLLLYLEKMRREGRLEELGLPDLRFAVVNSATYPPLYLDQETEDWVKSGGAGENVLSADAQKQKEKVTIPSLHLHGSTDPWRPESEKMKAEFFAEVSSSRMEYTGGHQVPLREQDTSKVVTAMRNFA